MNLAGQRFETREPRSNHVRTRFVRFRPATVLEDSRKKPAADQPRVMASTMPLPELDTGDRHPRTSFEPRSNEVRAFPGARVSGAA